MYWLPVIDSELDEDLDNTIIDPNDLGWRENQIYQEFKSVKGEPKEKMLQRLTISRASVTELRSILAKQEVTSRMEFHKLEALVQIYSNTKWDCSIFTKLLNMIGEQGNLIGNKKGVFLSMEFPVRHYDGNIKVPLFMLSKMPQHSEHGYVFKCAIHGCKSGVEVLFFDETDKWEWKHYGPSHVHSRSKAVKAWFYQMSWFSDCKYRSNKIRDFIKRGEFGKAIQAPNTIIRVPNAGQFLDVETYLDDQAKLWFDRKFTNLRV